MKLTVRYFASIREALGPVETIEAPVASTVGSVRDALIGRGGAHASALARGKALRTALNQVLCDEAAVVEEGAELAFFPPVTGG
ncbi:MoaD/ThiS family protein [Rhizobacter sp. Root404]|jgi:molybdopterin synthase sulfur carrier subunit|uniref:MoaD/ThiS family protein n=1 Tax=Rhizobacter sp. Root404 TaxID=1736528 RepID=UPI0006F2C07A|nr:MoaD/ThiS family protein [Rhizobacter sp. Root404]KQW37112.1 molybdopterin synthase sulfur carrier subunit [Rhizobacter sp. Root404]